MANSWQKTGGDWLRRGAILALIAGAGAGWYLPANAIVVRHDTGYSRYLATESDHASVFPLETRDRRKICVATLIHAEWAITAAHCAEETPLLATLQAGDRYPVTIAGHQRFVSELHINPGWPGTPGQRFDEQQVDLALLRLSEPLPDVTPVPLYRDDQELGQVVTFLGWGYSGVGSTGIRFDDGRLRFARNTVKEAATWLRFEFNDPSSVNSPAVDFEGIPGLGDSGGPALLTDSSGQAVLMGVAIGELASEERRRQGQYGAIVVYERISRHLDWIDQVTGQVSAVQ